MRFGIAKRHQSVAEDQAADPREAYERGRKEERARHRRSPLLTLGLGAAALVGGVTLVLSALHGSFAGGGASIDHGLSVAAREAGPALRGAGHSLKNAASDLKGKPAAASGKGA